MDGSRNGRLREALADRYETADGLRLDVERRQRAHRHSSIDTHLMTWNQVDGGACYRRHKTGVQVDVAISDDLQNALTATPRKGIYVLLTEYGKPYTVDGFSRFMRDAISAAGLPLDCQPHGLRKTLGRLLADAECSAHDIRAHSATPRWRKPSATPARLIGVVAASVR